ncbi:MAG: dephospho-CoA kinase [Muribaculaceae bacterium]|nr:dephospho-CoA kinase [Muribaculaceae bacterium]
MTITAITGGIGSGKSVVSRVVVTMGFPVYDCDTRAKMLMDNDRTILDELRERISPDVVDEDGRINRKLLSTIVFSDADKLSVLNEIVHGSVREDLRRWCKEHRDSERLFVETAILYQSGLDRMVDEVWEVNAPRQLRVERVMLRNGCEASEVERRMDSQYFVPERVHPDVNVIVNDGVKAVLPQINALL